MFFIEEDDIDCSDEVSSEEDERGEKKRFFLQTNILPVYPDRVEFEEFFKHFYVQKTGNQAPDFKSATLREMSLDSADICDLTLELERHYEIELPAQLQLKHRVQALYRLIRKMFYKLVAFFREAEECYALTPII